MSRYRDNDDGPGDGGCFWVIVILFLIFGPDLCSDDSGSPNPDEGYTIIGNQSRDIYAPPVDCSLNDCGPPRKDN